MAKIYKKNNWDRFTIPFYRRAIFWQAILFMISLVIALMISLLSISNIYLISLMILLVILLLISVVISSIKLIRRIKLHSLALHRDSTRIERQILKSLINTMAVNTMKQTKRIEVPDVLVDLKSIETNGRACVTLERLPAMNNLEDLIILVSNAFRKKYKNYAVVDFIEQTDALSYEFILEDVNIIKTFEPKTLDDITTDSSYHIKLQKGLIWELEKNPHGLISGVTSSGKTTTLYLIISHCLLNGINDIKSDINDGSLYLVDPKFEYSALNSFFKNIYTDVADVFDMLETVNKNLEERQQKISKLIKESGQLGATAFTFDIKPDIIIIDELTALVSMIPTSKKEEYNQDRFFKLISQIIQRGRSSGVYMIFAGQNFNSTTLPVAIRNSPSFRLLLGQGTQEDYKFIFANNTETIQDGGLPRRFMGYYTLSGVANNPQLFFVPALHTHKLNTVDAFKMAYEKGK